ncbi:UTRA domain-containing protein [Streptomyces avermitilis]|uniref:UTRA domain-containing protein n=1 Tax=Streptomyces avermitilis TaxID=33903 RepID=UPI003F4B6F71
MAELGRTGSWKAHSEARITAPDDIARRLGIEPGDLCVRTSYEFLADGQPGQLSISGEPMAITSETPIVLSEIGPFAGKGVVERMRSIGLDITNAIEVPRPARTSRRQANLLRISLGDLIIVIERTYYDGDGRAARRPTSPSPTPAGKSPTTGRGCAGRMRRCRRRERRRLGRSRHRRGDRGCR